MNILKNPVRVLADLLRVTAVHIDLPDRIFTRLCIWLCLIVVLAPAASPVYAAGKAVTTTTTMTPAIGTISSGYYGVVSGRNFTMTATVSPAAAYAGATFTFTSSASQSIAGCTSVPINSAGQATCTTNVVAPIAQMGPTFVATYSGNAAYKTSLQSIYLSVNAPSSISLTAADIVGVGIPAQLCALVNGGGSYPPVGNVAFIVNGSSVSTVQLNSDSTTTKQACTTYNYAAANANNQVQAIYNNTNANTASVIGSVKTVVSQVPTISLVSANNPGSAGAPTNFLVTTNMVGVAGGCISLLDASAVISPNNPVASINPTTVPVTLTTGGHHNITATYNNCGASNYATSNTVDQVINLGATANTISLSSSANPSVETNSVSFSASVSPSDATGTVTFKNGAAILGSAPLNSGIANLTTAALAIGTHSLSAVYSGDNTYASTTSISLNQQVNARAVTSVMLNVDIPSPVVHGTTQKFTATVTPASVTGSVIFMDGATTLATVALNGGVATLTTSTLSTATHNITAQYSGDSAYASSVSPVLIDVVNQGSSTVAIFGGSANAYLGYCYSLSGQIFNSSGQQAVDATGTAQFFKDTTSLGTVTVSNGTGLLSCFSPTLGANNISVKYSGDASYTASTSPPVIITGIKDSIAGVLLVRAGLQGDGDERGNHFYVGDTTGIEIWARGMVLGDYRGGPRDGTYTVKDGATIIGAGTPVATVINGQTYYLANIPTTATSFTTPGIHTLTVIYSGSASFADASINYNFLVTPVATTTLATTATPVGVNKSATLKATLLPKLGQTLPPMSNDVTKSPPVFKDGNTTISGTPTVLSQNSTSVVWTLSYTPTTTGNHTINVSYPKNIGAAAATAPPFNLPVMATGGSATVVTAPSSSLLASPLTITATIAGNTAAIPTGTVTFKDGATAIAGCSSLAIASSIATCTTSALTKGAHSITAVYSGDGANASSTSVAFSVAIASASTTTLTSSVNPVQVGTATMLTATVAPSTSTGMVNFFSGTTYLASGTLSSGVASAPVSFGAPATVTAVYQGDSNNYTSTSAALSQSISKLTPIITASPSSNPSPMGAGNIVFNFSNYYSRVSYRIEANGIQVASGNIGELGQNGLPTNINFPLNGFGIGSYTIIAYLVTDASNNGVSNTVVQQINPPVVLNVAPDPVAAGATFVATATVTGITPSGTITFKDGASTLGIVNLSAGVATLSTSIATVGTHSLTAYFSGDANNSASTSAAYSLQVGADVGLVSPGDMTTQYEYDANGNMTQKTDAIGHVSKTTYDSLNREATSVLPAHATGATPGVVTTTLDLANNVTKISDPRNVATNYTVNGMGEVKKLTSADTGISNFTFNAMGNPLTKTDARGMVSTMSYDEQHRLSSVTYTSGVSTTFIYDGGASPTLTDLGHLTKMTDESGSTVFSYDQLGRVVLKTVVINGKSFTIGYAYGTAGSEAGSLTSITYPSGSTVNYAYGTDGKVNAVSVNPVNANGVGVNATGMNVMSGIAFNALGEVSGWTWASGAANTRTFDSFGRLSSYFLGNPLGTGVASGLKRTISYDSAGKPIAFTHTNTSGAQAANDHSYAYDGRSRLISAVVAGTATGYDYDLTNNRTDLVAGGSDLVQAIAASSNRIMSAQAPGPITLAFAYDANGNVQNDGNYSYTYSARGRMSSAVTTSGTVNYFYNGMEQRAYKTGPTALVPTGAAYYLYDEAGHLLGEYDASGVPRYETAYLGDTPIAVLKTTGAAANSTLAVSMYNLYADHLDTPRVITRGSDEAIVWRWDTAEAFGGSAPNQNPNGLGSFVFNQRFPGQVFDAETGNLQNWHREYSPRIGRYLESDPIGLEGGINTYGYVEGNPISYIDRIGLEKTILFGYKQTTFWMGAHASSDSPGIMKLYAHGGPGVISGPNGSIISNTSDLANLLKANGWKPGMPVVFYACNTGRGKDSIAERFSKDFKTPTMAPDRQIWYSPWGPSDYPFGKNSDNTINRSDPGKWIFFGNWTFK